MRRICVVTGGRADYGLLRVLLREIKKCQNFKLQLIATGSHFSRNFGLTYREILKDGFKIDAKVDMKTNIDSAEGLGASMAIGLKGVARALAKLRPDILVLLGDRYEIMCAAAAGVISGIPIAHIHGGELTEGAYDDAFRHAITKMSQVHFVSTAVYQKRVIQLGEQPSRVFQVGALGVDNVKAQRFISRKELEKYLQFKFQQKNLLITFHPETLANSDIEQQSDSLLRALQTLSNVGMIFTMPGADRDGRVIWRKIRTFVRKHHHAVAFRALGSRPYLSIMREVDAVVGNSSSGLLEAPVLKKPVVNIGNRQKGRIRAANVIDADYRPGCISQAISKAFSPKMRRCCAILKNPYGQGGTAKRIVKALSELNYSEIHQKNFWDLSK